MKNLFIYPLKIAAKVFLGKGSIDKYFPKLITIYQHVYTLFVKKGTSIVSIPENSQLKVNNWDIGVGIPLIVKGYYERRETELFLSNIKKGMVIADIGANVGYYSVLAAKKTGNKGKVFAFEPDKNSRLLLGENIILNKLQNVIIEPLAISDKKGEIPFISEKVNLGSSSVLISEKKSGVGTVLSTTIDDYFKDTVIDVLKIDIEGSEISALIGAKRTIAKNKNLVSFIEYNPRALLKQNVKPQNLIELIKSYNFKEVMIIDETKNRMLPLTADNLEITLRQASFCNLFCKK